MFETIYESNVLRRPFSIRLYRENSNPLIQLPAILVPANNIIPNDSQIAK